MPAALQFQPEYRAWEPGAPILRAEELRAASDEPGYRASNRKGSAVRGSQARGSPPWPEPLFSRESAERMASSPWRVRPTERLLQHTVVT